MGWFSKYLTWPDVFIFQVFVLSLFRGITEAVISLPVMTPSSYIKLCLQQWVWNEIERASKHADLLSESDVNKRADIESKEDGSECVDGRHSWGAELVNNPVRSSMFQQFTNFCVSILLITKYTNKILSTFVKLFLVPNTHNTPCEDSFFQIAKANTYT